MPGEKAYQKVMRVLEGLSEDESRAECLRLVRLSVCSNCGKVTDSCWCEYERSFTSEE